MPAIRKPAAMKIISGFDVTGPLLPLRFQKSLRNHFLETDVIAA
jgi:hypothetical protein